MNRVPHSALNLEYPFKRLNGFEPELSHLRVIGARAFVHIEARTKKLATKAFEAVMVGYPFNSKGWRLWDAQRRRIVERD
ncbi:unnamed protein product, partial [Sphacelaria rigidula]